MDAPRRSERVFLDASGSAPMSPRTREALLAALDEGWADPDRIHAESRRARGLLDGARASIASLLGAPVGRTSFVPSFGLAFDRIVAGIAAARRDRSAIVATAIERRPLLRVAERVANDVTLVPVSPDGVVSLDDLRGALDDSVAMALVQHANQEVGAIQPVEAAHEEAAAAGVPLVVDATASIGHVDPPRAWDALAADAADWGGPRGVAVVAFAPGARWLTVPPVVTDRVSIPSALAAAVALEEREETRTATARNLSGLVSRLTTGLAEIPRVRVVDVARPALPHVLTFVCEGFDGEVVASALDREGFAVGSGSACTTEPSPESHVLEALGISTTGNVRVSVPPGTTGEQIDRLVAAVRGVVARAASS